MMINLFDQVQDAVTFIRSRTDFQPRTGIVLGTGLGGLVDEVVPLAVIPYTDIPHFAKSTVESHKGQLVLGHLGGSPVVVMAGRFHWYEGYSMQQVTFPIRVMKALGITQIIITNASGGINPHYENGDLVIVRDHINLLPDNPLRGDNDDRLGLRFPDLSRVYDAELRQKALKIAHKNGIRATEGVYSALSGPNLETPAEYNMLRILGSDCTGMSSVPEVLVARHAELRVLMISMVTNVSFPASRIRETTVEEVIATARASEPGMRAIIREIVSDE